ncbi:MAG TPA: hypothetical protein VHW01_06535 [Polyangiaceae bacterium]|jgi:hypothetical protein|nr:hypothetical protein [Polyangiaceae bacterium]
MNEPEPASERPPSVAEALKKTFHDTADLARAEIALVKHDALEQAQSAAHSAVLWQLTSLGMLLLFLVRATTLGFAVVGGFIAVASTLGTLGIRGMKRHKAPSAVTLKLDAREVAEAVR